MSLIFSTVAHYVALLSRARWPLDKQFDFDYLAWQMLIDFLCRSDVTTCHVSHCDITVIRFTSMVHCNYCARSNKWIHFGSRARSCRAPNLGGAACVSMMSGGNYDSSIARSLASISIFISRLFQWWRCCSTSFGDSRRSASIVRAWQHWRSATWRQCRCKALSSCFALSQLRCNSVSSRLAKGSGNERVVTADVAL